MLLRIESEESTLRETKGTSQLRRLSLRGTLRGFQAKMSDKLLTILSKSIWGKSSRIDSRLTGRLSRRERELSSRGSSRFRTGSKILLDRNILREFKLLIMLNQLKEKCLPDCQNINNSYSFYY